MLCTQSRHIEPLHNTILQQHNSHTVWSCMSGVDHPFTFTICHHVYCVIPHIMRNKSVRRHTIFNFAHLTSLIFLILKYIYNFAYEISSTLPVLKELFDLTQTIFRQRFSLFFPSHFIAHTIVFPSLCKYVCYFANEIRKYMTSE